MVLMKRKSEIERLKTDDAARQSPHCNDPKVKPIPSRYLSDNIADRRPKFRVNPTKPREV
jgi:hypothetical protein